MMRNHARRVGAVALAVGAVGTMLIGACASKKGALILAIETDMKAPKDVNAVSVTISTNGAIKHSFIGRVTPDGTVVLPATLAVVEPDDKSASIRIRVMAFQERRPRVLRDVRTTVPTGGRTALLRLPLNFVNDGSAVGASLPESGVLPPPGSDTAAASGAADFDFFGAFQPPCPDIQNQTIIDGACSDNFVDPETLPDFDSGLVGDSLDPGSCFDVAKCFAAGVVVSGAGTAAPDPNDAGTVPPPRPGADGGAKLKDVAVTAVTLDRNTCVLQLNGANPARLNLALVTPDTGDCVRPGECYVPIEHGAAGWREESGHVQLPAFVCKLLNGKNLRLSTATEQCAAKEESTPICAARPATKPGDDGGSNGGDQCTGSKTAPAVDTEKVVLQLSLVDLGELDPATRQPVARAWAKIGFDLDGLCTTRTSTNVCARMAGADSSKQEDGDQGIDNAYGRTVLGFILGLSPNPSKTASDGNSYLTLDGAGNGALGISLQGVPWSIPLTDVRIERTTTAGAVSGTLGARIPVEALVTSIEKVAGRISTQLCGGSTLDTIKQTIRQAADIPLVGPNRAGIPCDGVSIGITFTGVPVASVPTPVQGPDPCAPDGG